tara:strand:+ start:345 stop:1358 length:1014 start_codon:yes stop_codon:yes gene_type:complete
VDWEERMEEARRELNGEPKKEKPVGILEKAIDEIVSERMNGWDASGFDERIIKLVDSYLLSIPPRKIQINDLPELNIEGVVHSEFTKILSYVMAGYHIRLVGPTGSGKTHLVQQLVKSRNKMLDQDKPMYALSCTEETTRSDFIGRLFPTVDDGGNPRVEFLDGPVTRAAIDGAVCLIDEEDAARANVKACLFPLLENGILPVPGRPGGQVVTANKGCQIFANANTFGNGADMVYVGREEQDRAWLNRFETTTFYLDYDKKMEEKLGISEVCDWAWEIRPRMTEMKLRREVSTRTIIKMSNIIEQGLDKMDDLKSRFFMPWSKSEISKMGEFGPGYN